MARPPDDETPTTRPGRAISLDQLHDQEVRRQQRRAVEAIPVPIDAASETTGKVGRALFARLQHDEGGEDEVEALFDRFADRVASRTKRETTDDLKAAQKRKDTFEWLRFALGALGIAGALLAAWMGLRDSVAQRPTFADLKERLAPLMEQQAAQDRELRAQRDILIEVRGTVRTIDTAVKAMAEPPTPPRRRPR